MSVVSSDTFSSFQQNGYHEEEDIDFTPQNGYVEPEDMDTQEAKDTAKGKYENCKIYFNSFHYSFL